MISIVTNDLNDMAQEDLKITADDFGALCVCSQRYALGRKTYIVSFICDIIKKNISSLCERDLRTMIYDIENALDYGSSYDKENWMKLLKNLKEELDNRMKLHD